MSSNESRWYTFGRKTPLATREVGPIEPGTVYQFIGWSRTEDAALDKRDKMDRAGRAGINIFAASRQQAMADLVKVYDGVVVEGYISPEDKQAGRMIVKAAVVRAIFCPFTGQILDMRRAVVVATPTRSHVMVATKWDEVKDEFFGQLTPELRERVTVYDGRELFKR